MDRRKDAIRRRGENMSIFRDRIGNRGHPDVKEVAVVGVSSEYGEDEVLAVIVPVAEHTIDCAELIQFLAARMTRFMITRLIRIAKELPRTPIQEVQKHLVRAEWVLWR